MLNDPKLVAPHFKIRSSRISYFNWKLLFVNHFRKKKVSTISFPLQLGAFMDE